MQVRLLVIAVVSTVLLGGAAGCGDSGSPPPSPNALIHAALLTKQDLSKGWSKQPLVRIRGRCSGSLPESAVAFAGSHFAASTADVQQQIGVFATKALAEEAYATINSPEQMQCFRQVSERGMEIYSGGRVLLPLSDVEGPNPGGGTEAQRMVAQVESPIGPVTVYVDRVATNVGRIVVLTKVINGFEPPDGRFYRKVVSVPLKRVTREMSVE